LELKVTQEIKRREAVQAGIDINNPIGLPYEGYVAPDYSNPYATTTAETTAAQAGGNKTLTNPATGQTMEVLVNDPRFAGLSEAEQIALGFSLLLLLLQLLLQLLLMLLLYLLMVLTQNLKHSK
jgi:hypothetical protein